MKLISSKTSMPPSAATPTPTPVVVVASASGSGNTSVVDSSSELLQLRLENSELRNRLEDALSHTDESKSELLQLLEEQTTQTNLLQSKCDELAAGFVEIDKERRALRKSAEDARQDSIREVERTREESEKRCKDLEKHIKVREKEVEKLAERTREQERRIEAAVAEWHDRQSKVDELEGELEKMILLVDKEREERKKANEQHAKVMERAKMKEDDLEQRIQKLQQSLQAKEAAVANLQQDQELSKMEHEQALKTMSDRLEAQKSDFEAQQKKMNELHQNESSELMNTLQSQLDSTADTIQSLTSEMKQLQIVHNEKVAEFDSSIREWTANTRAIEMKYQQSCESNEQLQGELDSIRSSYQIEQKEVKAMKYLLEKENGDLVEELDGTKAQLAAVKEKLSNLQMEHTGLQCKYSSLEDTLSDLKEKKSTLVSQLERMTTDYEQKHSQLSKKNSVLEQQLTKEKISSNNLSLQLRELNAKVSEDVSVLQQEKRMLQQELENANMQLSMKDKDALDLHSRYEASVSSHLNEKESLKSKHAEEISVIEMRCADIVSDLEEAIGALEKSLADNKLENVQVVNSMTLEKERLERSLYDKERKVMELDGKITSLTAYAKERKEEVKSVKSELTQTRQTLDSTKREYNNAVDAVRSELEKSRDVHQQEMCDMKKIIDEVRLELSMAKERLATDDGELERAKATLSERTNLLRDMVNQTTAYQGDYERERNRANTLEEAVSSYKRQLAEARDVGQHLEREIHEKDTHYCDAIRNERQQRKAMESELESSRKLLEDIVRKHGEMEKENSALKDKVARQEGYIGRLQDREKRERSKVARPSTAGSAANKHRGNIASYQIVDENLKPNLK